MGAICSAMLSTRYAKAFQDSTHIIEALHTLREMWGADKNDAKADRVPASCARIIIHVLLHHLTPSLHTV